MKVSYHYACVLLPLFLVLCGSCSAVRRTEALKTPVSLQIPEPQRKDVEPEVIVDAHQGPDDPLLMDAVRDDSTGTLYAMDYLQAAEVVARFKTVAERGGQVNLSFDLRIPESMVDSRWQLKFYPYLELGNRQQELEPVFITGAKYREQQLRGYERYRKFINSIILDPERFIRKDMLEIFLKRNFPQIYQMKTDSSYVPEDVQDSWGVTRQEVIDHYTRKRLQSRHRRRWEQREERFRKYVPDPFPEGKIRLDSVIQDKDMLVYSYSQPVKVSRGLKKILLHVRGELYESGHLRSTVPAPDTLEFYITSLSSLMEKVERKKTKIISRRVCDNMEVAIDFRSSRWEVDTAYRNNGEELVRIGKCIDRIVKLEEMVLDSLVISATCSPEGSLRYNTRLSQKRSSAISAYVDPFLPDSLKDRVRIGSVPENWTGLCRRVEADTVMERSRRNFLLGLLSRVGEDRDLLEKDLSREPEYAYLRENIYPSLRTVTFDFHLHRPDMQQDTVHTEEPDLVYMEGLEAIRGMDYKTAVSRLRSYKDYNAALACVLADCNHSALEILEGLEENASILYLKALVLARLGQYRSAEDCLNRSIRSDPSMEFRAGLDPELSSLIYKIKRQ